MWIGGNCNYLTICLCCFSSRLSLPLYIISYVIVQIGLNRVQSELGICFLSVHITGSNQLNKLKSRFVLDYMRHLSTGVSPESSLNPRPHTSFPKVDGFMRDTYITTLFTTQPLGWGDAVSIDTPLGFHRRDLVSPAQGSGYIRAVGHILSYVDARNRGHVSPCVSQPMGPNVEQRTGQYTYRICGRVNVEYKSGCITPTLSADLLCNIYTHVGNDYSP